MLSTRVETQEMFRVTYERLVDEYKELQLIPPESLQKDDQEYRDNLLIWINTKPVPLNNILKKAEDYIARNTTKKPSKRWLPFYTPQYVADLVDMGVSYAGVKVHQEEAKEIKATALIKLNLINKNKHEYLYVRQLIQAALADLDKIYTRMHGAKITTGEVIEMLEETFNAYHYTPQTKRLVMVHNEPEPEQLRKNNPPPDFRFM